MGATGDAGTPGPTVCVVLTAQLVTPFLAAAAAGVFAAAPGRHVELRAGPPW